MKAASAFAVFPSGAYQGPRRTVPATVRLRPCIRRFDHVGGATIELSDVGEYEGVR